MATFVGQYEGFLFLTVEALEDQVVVDPEVVAERNGHAEGALPFAW